MEGLAIQVLEGTVISISAFGNGVNSAEVEVTLKLSNGPDTTVRIAGYPATEPQAYNMFGHLLTMSYFNKHVVKVQVLSVPNGTLQVLSVSLPAPTVT
jgi:hypothetical protein